ncbi:MAG: SpoIIE family protein phosphatase [Eubacteriales bacterium]|nr:SpoIIE family protein phosphatase [Eubacteriales bacterium]
MDPKKKTDKKLISIIQKWLSVVAITALIISALGVGYLIKVDAEREVEQVLRLNVSDVKTDIVDASDSNLLSITEEVAASVNSADRLFENTLFVRLAKNDLQSAGYSTETVNELFDANPMQFLTLYLAVTNDLPEIDIVDTDGIITASTNESFIGFDMASGSQSAEFLCLLENTKSYVQSYQPISYDNSISRKYAGVQLSDGGFVQVGYDAERFHKDIADQVVSAAKNRHVGETGSIMIVDKKGQVLSSPITRIIGHSLGEFGISTLTLDERANDIPFIDAMNGTAQTVLGTSIEGYYIFAMVPREETMQTVYTSSIAATAIIALVLLAVIRIIFHLVKKFVVNSVDEIAVSLDKITNGDLDVVVDTRGTLEFDSLSDNINSTVASLKDMAAKEAARFEAELEYAKNIQSSALPSIIPDKQEFELFATMTPAKEVGGDFFDYELINQELLSICVADVSGKGVPAALFMMRAKTLIRDYCLAGLSVNEVLRKVNSELCENNQANMFVTCWFGILNTKTGQLQYSNAGHNPPLKGHCGSFEYLKDFRPDFVLAGMDGMNYKLHELQLLPGDELFIYTDGVTEATNLNNQLYGEDRLKFALNSFKGMSCEEKCRYLREDIDAFTGEAPQFDDITMLSLKYN